MASRWGSGAGGKAPGLRPPGSAPPSVIGVRTQREDPGTNATGASILPFWGREHSRLGSPCRLQPDAVYSLMQPLQLGHLTSRAEGKPIDQLLDLGPREPPVPPQGPDVRQLALSRPPRDRLG